MTAWAALYVYEREAEIRGEGDHEFLARVFDRLLTNFTWWVNRKDPDDRNLFQGGFLGLDNIGIFDRSAPLPGGGTLEQADGTAWMALYCQWMLQIAVELAKHDPAYADMALKFLTHFEWISVAMNPPEGDTSLWDEEDGFYYDVMRMPDGAADPAQGPLAGGPAADVRRDGLRRARWSERYPMFAERVAAVRRALLRRRARAGATCPGPARRAGGSCRSSTSSGCAGCSRSCSTRTSSSVPTGSARSRAATSSKPYVFDWGGQEYNVHYLPAESDTGMFGGNSNWRGPGLVPDEHRDPARAWSSCTATTATGSRSSARPARDRDEPARGRDRDRDAAGHDIHEGRDGRRPVFGGIEKFQTDPHWHDLMLFHEYFHGDNGAGIGASHQTGWTGTVALLFMLGGALHSEPTETLGPATTATRSASG